MTRRSRPFRELEEASLLRRAARRPAESPTIVRRLPLPPPCRTPQPIRIDPSAEASAPPPAAPVFDDTGVVVARGSAPRLPGPARPASAPPEPQDVSLASGPVRITAARAPSEDDYLSIAMVVPPEHPTPPWVQRLIIILALVVGFLMALFLLRLASADGSDQLPDPRPAAAAAPAPSPAAPPPAAAVLPVPAAPVQKSPAALPAPSASSPLPIRAERSDAGRLAPPAHDRSRAIAGRARSKGPRADKRPAPVRAAAAPTPGEPALLTLDAIPYGAVSIDGRAMGDTPLIRVSLPAGTHDVRITTRAGETRRLSIDLEPGAHVRRRVRFEGGR